MQTYRKFARPRGLAIALAGAALVLSFQNCAPLSPTEVLSSGSQANRTTSGVTLPNGFALVAADRFGTAADRTVSTFAQLHARYFEAQYYNRDANGLVTIPNTVINGEQQTYAHFEDAIVFATDHLTIQGRGHPDGTITSAEMVSRYAARSFCVEARYQTPSGDKSWPALWWYADGAGGDSSEIDIEQPITPNQGVHHVSFHNHPYEYDAISILTPGFTTNYMTFYDETFDASAAPHVYTTCYDDAAARITHWIDGTPIFNARWTWNKSMGGTGFGPDAVTILNLAVGGAWPGNLTNPSAYVGDFDIYYVEYYAPL